MVEKVEGHIMHRTMTVSAWGPNRQRKRRTVRSPAVVASMVAMLAVSISISIVPVGAFVLPSPASQTDPWNKEAPRKNSLYHPARRADRILPRRRQSGSRPPPRRTRLLASVPDDEVDDDERKAGLLVLLTVPMAWGTFEPAVRYVYDIQPDVPPFLFQFIYYLIAASSLVVALSASSNNISFSGSPKEAQVQKSNPSPVSATTLTSNSSYESESSIDNISFRGGLELGTYLFLGNAMQVVGLKTIPSDRAAFLLQLTTIFVPLVQSVVARNFSILPVRTWLACFMALAGVAFIGLDGSSSGVEHYDVMAVSSSSPMDNLSFSQGDAYIILAALFYTFHCLRLEAYAKKTPALKLAVAKASTETLWCGLAIVASLVAATVATDDSLLHSTPLWDVARTSGKNILEYTNVFWDSVQDPTISFDQWFKLGAATTWIGLVTVGYTISAQSFGQARVPAATANLIYTIQPIFTAVVAFLVLGEMLGSAGYAGGLLIGSAVFLVIQNDDGGVDDPS
jgi:drug/metabolite transporter (DMT)-like permease